MRFYVYDLIDPRTNQTFYVGKGQKNRVKQHLYDAEHGKKGIRLDRIREILKEGYSLKYEIVYWFEFEIDALEFEIERIKSFPPFQLVNIDHEIGKANSVDFNIRKSILADKKRAYKLAELWWKTDGFTWFPFRFYLGNEIIKMQTGSCQVFQFMNMQLELVKRRGSEFVKEYGYKPFLRKLRSDVSIVNSRS